jgi:hypothetical protein
VVFEFNVNSTDNAEWGYRCMVIGHMPSSEQETIWSTHLEKTLCSLGGQLTSLLIVGYDINELVLRVSCNISKCNI